MKTWNLEVFVLFYSLFKSTWIQQDPFSSFHHLERKLGFTSTEPWLLIVRLQKKILKIRNNICQGVLSQYLLWLWEKLKWLNVPSDQVHTLLLFSGEMNTMHFKGNILFIVGAAVSLCLSQRFFFFCCLVGRADASSQLLWWNLFVRALDETREEFRERQDEVRDRNKFGLLITTADCGLQCEHLKLLPGVRHSH